MESRKARHQHEIKAAESLDAAQSTLNNPTPGKKRKKGRGRRNRVIAFILLIIVLIGLVFGVKNLLTDKNAALNPKDTTFKRRL